MEVYDIIILVILVGATLWGARRGLVTQVASIVSIALSYFVAYEFRDQVASMIDQPAPWNMFLAMLLAVCGHVVDGLGCLQLHSIFDGETQAERF